MVGAGPIIKSVRFATGEGGLQVLHHILASALIAAGGSAMGQIISQSLDVLDGADPADLVDRFMCDVNNCAHANGPSF